MSENVKVCARFRPLNDRETKKGTALNADFPSETQVQLKGGDKLKYTFDRVFQPHEEQQDVFEFVGLPMVEEVFNGFNSTIFAYGQTGSGKTHTMTGKVGTEIAGIIPRLVSALFERIEALTGR